MKKHVFLIFAILAFIAEICALVIFAVHPSARPQDTVAINEAVQTVTQNFDALDGHKNPTSLDYVVLDNDGKILYRTKEGLSESVNSAVAHRDTMLGIERDGKVVGKIIFFNTQAQELQLRERTVVIVLALSIAVECLLCAVYAAYMYLTVVKPFRKLKGFAERVAGGNLDIPLEMDRKNLFGAFTESFDIMRSELKKARLAEAQAQKSKKELVAKLSHDIKTPVASIKAVSEVGLAVTENEKDRDNYKHIIGKADQINALVTNLFTATLEELQQLTVTPENIESRRIKAMLENADYLHRANAVDMPECLVCADALRLQQVFDNIFANAYKYAKTNIEVTAVRTEKHICVTVEDFGGGVEEQEISVLKEKFKRGSNAKNTEGAGLGLYISDYFMTEMGGELKVENGEHGLKVTIAVALSGAI